MIDRRREDRQQTMSKKFNLPSSNKGSFHFSAIDSSISTKLTPSSTPHAVHQPSFRLIHVHHHINRHFPIYQFRCKFLPILKHTKGYKGRGVVCCKTSGALKYLFFLLPQLLLSAPLLSTHKQFP